MARYIALISSLPMLELEGDSFMTKEKFLSWCEGTVPEKDLEKLKNFTPRSGISGFPEKSFAGKYLRWEQSLRNACVQLRAGKAGEDPRKWQRYEDHADPSAATAAIAAFSEPDPLLREKSLDTARWTKAEELEQGEWYSLNRLYAFKLKLELRESWRKRDSLNASGNMDSAAEAIRGIKS